MIQDTNQWPEAPNADRHEPNPDTANFESCGRAGRGQAGFDRGGRQTTVPGSIRKHPATVWHSALQAVECSGIGVGIAGRPLVLLQDLPSVTLPVEWPSTPIEELEDYGTFRPNGPFEPPGR